MSATKARKEKIFARYVIPMIARLREQFMPITEIASELDLTGP